MPGIEGAEYRVTRGLEGDCGGGSEGVEADKGEREAADESRVRLVEEGS